MRYFIFSEPNYSTSNFNLNETKIPCEPGKTAFLMSCKQSRCTMYIVGCSVVSRTFFRLFLSNGKLKENLLWVEIFINTPRFSDIRILVWVQIFTLTHKRLFLNKRLDWGKGRSEILNSRPFYKEKTIQMSIQAESRLFINFKFHTFVVFLWISESIEMSKANIKFFWRFESRKTILSFLCFQIFWTLQKLFQAVS